MISMCLIKIKSSSEKKNGKHVLLRHGEWIANRVQMSAHKHTDLIFFSAHRLNFIKLKEISLHLKPRFSKL